MKKNKPKNSINNRTFSFKISPFLILMAVVFFLQGSGYLFISYMVAVLFHEFAHAEAAQKLGYRLHKLNLNPYGASLIGDFEGVKPRDEIFIALAGPLVNIALIIISIALWWIFPSSYFITQYFVIANIFIAFFNLIPVFPLDGGRILLAALSLKMPRNKAYRKMRIFGFVMAGIMISAFVVSALLGILNLSFAATGTFIFIASLIPDKSSYYQRLYSVALRSKNLKRGLVSREIIVGESATILSLMKLLSNSYFTKFIIVDSNFRELLNINEFELERLSIERGLDGTIISKSN